MDAAGLDGFARKLAGRSGRRSLVAGVAGALAAALVGDATAGKHKKKATLCLNEQIVKAASKKKKKTAQAGSDCGRLLPAAVQRNDLRWQ